MSEELLPCPFCGGECHKTTLCMHNESLVECNNQKCALFGRIMKTSTWNTRPDSKPYKWATWKEWWGSLPFDGRKTYKAADGFNAAREREE